jgi:hypothetical protein
MQLVHSQWVASIMTKDEENTLINKYGHKETNHQHIFHVSPTYFSEAVA